MIPHFDNVNQYIEWKVHVWLWSSLVIILVSIIWGVMQILNERDKFRHRTNKHLDPEYSERVKRFESLYK